VFVVDASVWVARYKPTDANHAASRQWLNHVFDNRVQVVSPALLLPEAAGPIAREASELDARRVLSELLRLLTLRLVPLRIELAGVAAQLAARLRMRGADSVYVALAYDLDMPLVTWDDEQRSRGGAVVTVRTPEELLAQP
jgi:predicted nucleic acid-binding protein